MAARGYAVLLPDPALSQGYGLDFVRRGWGEWGGAPYTDLMAAQDAAVERPEIDDDPHGGDGRLVRRVHGELGRHPDRPVPRRSSRTPACGSSTRSAGRRTPRTTGRREVTRRR